MDQQDVKEAVKDALEERQTCEKSTDEILAKAKHTQLREDEWRKLSEDQKSQVAESKRPDYERPGNGGAAVLSVSEVQDLISAVGELRRMHESTNIRDRLIVKLMFYGALRRGEAVLVQRKQLRPGDNALWIDASSRKTDKRHIVSLPADLTDRLHRWSSNLKPDDHLFQPANNTTKECWPEPDGAPLAPKNWYYRCWDKLRDKLVSDYGWGRQRAENTSCHSLRKAMATHVASELGLEAARKLLDHCSIEVTKRYVEVPDEQISRAVQRLSSDLSTEQLQIA